MSYIEWQWVQELLLLVVVLLLLLLPNSKVSSHRHAQSGENPPNRLRLGTQLMRPLLGIGPTPTAPAPGSLQNASKPMLQSPPRHAAPTEPAAGSPRGPPASSLGSQGTHRLPLAAAPATPAAASATCPPSSKSTTPITATWPPQPQALSAPWRAIAARPHHQETSHRQTHSQATVQACSPSSARYAQPEPPTQSRRQRIQSGSNTHMVSFKCDPRTHASLAIHFLISNLDARKKLINI